MDISKTKNADSTHVRNSDNEPGVKNLQRVRGSRSHQASTDIYSVVAPASKSSQITVTVLDVGHIRLATACQ